jgi:YHS domain-containing protein
LIGAFAGGASEGIFIRIESPGLVFSWEVWQMKKTLAAGCRALLGLVVLLSGAPAVAGGFYAPDGVGASGYDVVAYFSEQRAAAGQKEFEAEYGGVLWRFASAENRDAFAAAPDKYLPQYGGHCAYGAAQGYLVKSEPTAWSIADGKLYLNYNIRIRERWLADRERYIQTANAKWPALSK